MFLDFIMEIVNTYCIMIVHFLSMNITQAIKLYRPKSLLLLYFSSVDSIYFQNNPKDLDPSNKRNLGLLDFSEWGKTHLIIK